MTRDATEADATDAQFDGDVTLASELAVDDAAAEIAEAVGGRRGAARKYVLWLRRRQPDASPADLIRTLERHYVIAISGAGAAVTAGTIAVSVGLDLLPGGGTAKTAGKTAAKTASKAAAKKVAKESLKAAGKRAAISAAKEGAKKGASLLPAGDERVQFEITGLFALALAEVHGWELDDQQSQALVYGLSNGQVTQQRIAAVAADLADTGGAPEVTARRALHRGPATGEPWAKTLAGSLPGARAQDFVRGMDLGALDDLRASMTDRHRNAADMGVGAAFGGVTRFVFGRQVVEAAREAFSQAPEVFPRALSIQVPEEGQEKERSRALLALEEAAKSAGSRVGAGAAAVGLGTSTAADAITKPFRHVDLDGDGVPDEPQALTTIKSAASAAGRVARPFRRVDLDGDGIADEPQALTAMKGLKRAVPRPKRLGGSRPSETNEPPNPQPPQESPDQ